MSTEKVLAKRRLSSSEGTGTENNTANLDEQELQAQQLQQNEVPITTALCQIQRRESTTQDNKSKDDGNALAAGNNVRIQEGEAASVTHGYDSPRQVIAVSANKNPTAFFQLARKFLMTNDTCDLSALEGAIVSAVDAAHLLERSQLASIVRINTSYVHVEPKRRRQGLQQRQQGETPRSETSVAIATEEFPSKRDKITSSGPESTDSNTIEASSSASTITITDQNTPVSIGMGLIATTQNERQGGSSRSSSGGRELRRARILVTVRRTESYKKWLEDNPLQRQAIIADENIVDSNVAEQSLSSSGE